MGVVEMGGFTRLGTSGTRLWRRVRWSWVLLSVGCFCRLGASVGWAEAAAMRAGGTKRLKCMVAVGLMLVDGFLEVTSVLVSGKGRTAMAGSSTLFTRYLQGDGKPQPAKFASHNTPRGSITNTRSMQ
jgi:hypothetical protein